MLPDGPVVNLRIPSVAVGPVGSLHALDRLNFFLAALQAGFGPFVAVHLADRGWAPASIGFVLTAGGLAGLASQVPAGELLDIVRSKRALVGAGSLAVAVAALILGLSRSFPAILVASVTQGATGGVLGLGIAAISLGLVGQAGAAERFGRNQRFASLGSLAAAALMGVIGYALSTQDIFFAAAALDLPALMALAAIHAADIHFARSCCGKAEHPAAAPQRERRGALLHDRRLLIFAVCLFLFQLANASLLPLVGETLAHAEGRQSSLVLSALLVAPQLVVALAAPWAGRAANRWGRRPLLLIGLGVVPIRSLSFAATTSPALLVAAQALDGITGATLGVLTALVIADLTRGTGRFNLAQGLVGALSGIGASLSTSLSGLTVGAFGPTAGFLGVTAVALASVAILWALMPETKPPDEIAPASSSPRNA